ncbi:MAG: hydroxymethylpyrimidine/phosphomethylpyrimidine kinase [Muribaculaceae bacterium]|nr:hydroxymethylpyrimidine/phosphomethylpyrimidine kinase [Muribaculaceae bacterium]
MLKFLTIAGSDCIGGAGVQADIKTAQFFGLYSASAITAITVQNSKGLFKSVATDEYMLQAQVEAVLEDFIPDCIKIGMLCTPQQVMIVADILEQLADEVKIVADPVLAPSMGNSFISDLRRMLDLYLYRLLPLTTIATPNRNEWNKFLEIVDNLNPGDSRNLTNSEIVRALKLKALLITDGDSTECTDELISCENDYNPIFFMGEHINTRNHHGTGCVFSSALAALLAKKLPLTSAIAESKKFVTDGLRSGASINFADGYGPANFFI